MTPGKKSETFLGLHRGDHKIIMVGGPDRMPIVQKFVEDYVGKKVEHGIDPMECVALGAAVQAAVLTGEVKDVLLLDVTPLTLGIETLGSVRTPLIDRKHDNSGQKISDVSNGCRQSVLGRDSRAAGRTPGWLRQRLSGKFILETEFPPAQRGIPQIEVSSISMPTGSCM